MKRRVYPNCLIIKINSAYCFLWLSVFSAKFIKYICHFSKQIQFEKKQNKTLNLKETALKKLYIKKRQ